MSSKKPLIFGNKVQAIRGALRWTQAQLARRAKVARNTVITMESDTNTCPEFFATHDRVAMALTGVNAEWLDDCSLSTCLDNALRHNKVER